MPVICIGCGRENPDNALLDDGSARCGSCGSYPVTANKNIARPTATAVP